MYVSVNQVHFGVQMNETFVDTKRIPIHKKRVRPLDQQGEYESRRLVHFSHLQYLKFRINEQGKLISTQKTSHKHNSKDLSCLQ